MSYSSWNIGFIEFTREAINLHIPQFPKLSIRWYGLCYLISYLLISHQLKKESEKAKIGLSEDQFSRLAEISFMSGIIGGRLWYLIFRYMEYGIEIGYRPFHVWEGGMAYQGGLILGVLGGIGYMFFIKKAEAIGKLLDIATSKLPLGIMIGRFGNFANEEFMNQIFGIPSCLFSSITEGLIPYLILNHTFNFRKYEYVSSSAFFMLYSLIRFLNDFYREEKVHEFVFMELKLSQYVCIVIFFLSLAILAFRFVLQDQQKLSTDPES